MRANLPDAEDCNIRWYFLVDILHGLGRPLANFIVHHWGPMEISDIAAYKMPATYATISGTGGGGLAVARQWNDPRKYFPAVAPSP